MKQFVILSLMLLGINPVAVVAQTSGAELRTFKRERAEINRGKWVVGVTGLGGWSNGSSNYSGFWSVTPQVGYTVANRLVVGLQVGLGRDYFKRKQTSLAVPEYQFYSLASEAYGRYYFFNFKIRPFVQVSTGLNMQRGTQDTDLGNGISHRSSNYIGAGAIGASMMIGRRVALEAMYNHRFFTKSQIADANDKTKVRIGLSFFIK